MAQETYRLIVTWRSADQFAQNVLHYRMDDAAFASRLLAAEGLILGWLNAEVHFTLLNMVPAACVMKSIRARRITNGGGPEFINVSVDGEDGERTGIMQTSSVGPVIIFNTNGGPRRVGKVFLPGISDTDVEGGEITQALLDVIQDGANNMMNEFPAVGGGTPQCLLVIPRSNDPSVRSLILQAQISKNTGKQRRRQLPV